ncbi:hypothetical protein [Epibacterium sp. Ofav1-8]|jgi:hypothetical protein|uniref:hypothetical protein n=1 Tax=Epibacterium sp. Ofav1-8 TaxID=2917735 RepID=UPI001EF595EC|nr:hypothetical protein [Epibacterium sp. Ofav1-8]MCG7624556.1 hypothetical protein [Epibacterium sp. Ofav1-8]
MMPRLHTGFAGLCLALLPSLAPAQGAAVAEARARLVCGSGTVVSATYIPGGLLQVTCRQNAPSSSNASNSGSTGNSLGTGGLGSTGVAVGAVAAAVALTVATSSSDATTTTAASDDPEPEPE